MSVSNLPTTVPVEVAKSGTENWRQFYTEITGCPNDQIFRGFHIPVADLKALLTEAGDRINGVRAYFALENPYNPDEPTAPNEVHIFLVPVEDNVDLVEDQLGKSNVCDFTTPCPKICDAASVLYNL